MNKRIAWLISILLMCLLMMAPAFAADEGYFLLMDEADLLTEGEEASLLAKLEEISARQGMDVVVVTVSGLNGVSSMPFADDYFDDHGYGQGADRSGVLLLHSPEERDWWISTRGEGIQVFTDYGIECMGEQIIPYLRAEDWASAYHEFADLCDDYITQARTEEPYDIEEDEYYGPDDEIIPDDPGYTVRQKRPPSIAALILSLGVGFLISLIVINVMKGKMKSVHFQTKADRYVVPGSLQIPVCQDLFLYRTVNKIYNPPQQNRSSNSSRGGRSTRIGSSHGGSSTHIGHSGASHGGGGGKY